MRVKMEKESKSYSFTKLLKQILHCLKVIESEKVDLFKTCPDFNVMDAFRALDTHAKGLVSSVELMTGLMDVKIYSKPFEISVFFKNFDINNSKKLRFSDFSKALLP